MTPQSLFPDAALSRQERAERIDQQIASLTSGQCGGPFQMVLTADESAVLRAIRYHRGAGNAVPIRELKKRIKLSERQIKGVVRSLRVSYHLPIGSSKASVDGGYFIMLTIEDQRVFDASFLDQVRAQVEAHRAVCGPERTQELLGQLSLEVKA